MSFHARMDYAPARFHKSERALADLGEPFVFAPEHQATFDRIATRYPPERRKSAILAALHLVQDQQGYISRASMRFVAQQIEESWHNIQHCVAAHGYMLGFTDVHQAVPIAGKV